MKISTKGRYGLRAMMDMASRQDKGPVAIQDIAQQQGLSYRYLEHLMFSLKKAGLIKSVRGPMGGYALAKKSCDITVGEIIRALEGPIAPVDCVNEDCPEQCERSGNCAARLVWVRIRDCIADVLDSLTLENMVDMQKKCQIEKHSHRVPKILSGGLYDDYSN